MKSLSYLAAILVLTAALPAMAADLKCPKGTTKTTVTSTTSAGFKLGPVHANQTVTEKATICKPNSTSTSSSKKK